MIHELKGCVEEEGYNSLIQHPGITRRFSFMTPVMAQDDDWQNTGLNASAASRFVKFIVSLILGFALLRFIVYVAELLRKGAIVPAISPLYLQWVSFWSFFRCVMYFVDLDGVSQVKIRQSAWRESAAIRELGRTWCKAIRLMMGFRAVWCACASTFDSEAMALSSFINFSLDLLLLVLITTGFKKEDPTTASKSVKAHQQPFIPCTVQILITSAYPIALFFL